MIKYVFWDSDNTLLNTAEHHWRKHFETLKTLSIHLNDEYRTRIYTNNGSQNWQWLTADLGLDMAEQDYLDAIDAWFFDHIDEIEIRPGVPEALELFKSHNIPQAVISNGRKKSVMAGQTAKDLPRYFEFIFCKEDYEGRKPDPAPYLAGIRELEKRIGQSISPDQCLAIEDDPKGVKSARAANMHVIDRPPGNDDPKDFIEKCRKFLT